MQEGSAVQLWQAALLRLQSQVTRPNFDTWLKDTVGLRLEQDPSGEGRRSLVVGARSDFAIEWLAAKLRPTIGRILTSLAAHVTDVTFEVLGVPTGTRPQGSPPPADGCSESEALLPAEPSPSPWPQPRLDPRFTFDTFVVGSANRLAHGAAMAVASSPGSLYNPLVICGPSGLGKTHLLRAIASEAVRTNQRVAYASAEQFTNDYARASRDR